MPRKTAPLMPATQELLRGLGERLRLARRRRRLSAKQVAARAGMAPMTLRSLERGGAGVTMGAYLGVMQVLGIEGDIDLVAQTDPVGRSLQDAQLSRSTGVASHKRSSPESSSVRKDVAANAERQPLEGLPVRPQESLTVPQMRTVLSALPKAQIQRALSNLPLDQLQQIAHASSKLQAARDPAIERSLGKAAAQIQAAVKSLPPRKIHEAVSALDDPQVKRAFAALSSDEIQRMLAAQARTLEQLRKPLEGLEGWIASSSFVSSRALAEMIDLTGDQSPSKKR